MGYYVLSEDAATKLRKLLGDSALIEVRAGALQTPPVRPMNDPVHYVRVTADAAVDGTYTGYWQKYLVADDTWEDGDECRVREVAGGTLEAGKHLARRYGLDADGYPVFVMPTSGFRGFYASQANTNTTIASTTLTQTRTANITWDFFEAYGGVAELNADGKQINILAGDLWLLTLNVMWDDNHTGSREIGIFWGTPTTWGLNAWVNCQATAAGYTAQSVSYMTWPYAGQYVGSAAHQDSGGDRTVSFSSLSGILLSG